MFKVKFLPMLASATVVSLQLSTAAFAQLESTLRDPLIPGGLSSTPGVAPPTEPLPPLGDPGAPPGVTPGMGGSPTLLPWVPDVPANDIDTNTSAVGLPFSPSLTSAPGILGPSLTGLVPNSPSTPGPVPLYLSAPVGLPVPSQELGVLPLGGLPGTGGYGTSISQIRRGGQQTRQYEERGRNVLLGAGTTVAGGIQDEVAQTGALAGYGLPYGIPTGNGYNKGPAGSNTDVRNSSIDLGGGQRVKIGGVIIPLGNSLQDDGASATRGNAIGALQAFQSTEFGQGVRGEFRPNNTTTDYGLGFKDFAANAGIQATGQKLNPNAVETNF